MQTVAQWLTGKRFRIDRMHRGDLRHLLDEPCNIALSSMRARRPFYVEAQQKQKAPVNRTLGFVPVHGIGLETHRSYQALGVPVWLLIAEVLNGELLALKISDVAPDTTFEGETKFRGVDQGGMAYFLKERFELLAELTHPDGGHKQLVLNGLA